MSDNVAIDVYEDDFSITSDHLVDASVIGTNEGPSQYSNHLHPFGDTYRAFPNESFSTDSFPETSIDSNYYPGAETLLNQPLVLEKRLKSLADIRYKTDYFPRTGPNAGKPQSPRYLHTEDGGQEVIIKFPKGFIPPPNPNDYLLECRLLTVSTTNEYYMHAYKFQLNHEDETVEDQNPIFLPLTNEYLNNGEIRMKLVVIKEKQCELKKIKSLLPFDSSTNSDGGIICNSFKELKTTYQFNHGMIAFSLGYFDRNDRFIRFSNTTIITNKIIEKNKTETKNNVICPYCSHHFSIKKLEKKRRKRLS